MIEMPASEPFEGETLLADGWVYRDLPKMTFDALELFTEIVGLENMRWLTIAEYGPKGGPKDTVRGQLFISPAGMERMKAYAEKH